jgi:hypothetical protein
MDSHGHTRPPGRRDGPSAACGRNQQFFEQKAAEITEGKRVSGERPGDFLSLLPLFSPVQIKELRKLRILYSLVAKTT